ncbi:MAG: hypothetical protein K6G36_03405 [Candidatus Saccharibacteria bacterium]|nr:hypothetical protein [Candidatus Saccharibacteria bacterium]
MNNSKATNNQKADYYRKGFYTFDLWYQYLLAKSRPDVHSEERIKDKLGEVETELKILNDFCENVGFYPLSGNRILTVEWLTQHVTSPDECRRVKGVLGVSNEKAYDIAIRPIDSIVFAS